MVDMGRMLQDWSEAGDLASLLPICAFITDDGTFLTKSGAVGQIFKLSGVDAEGADHATRERVVHRFAASLRPLDERFTVSQYIEKRRVDPFVAEPCAHPIAAAALRRRADHLNARRESLYAFDLYLAIVLEGKASRMRTPLRRQTTLQVLRADLERRTQELQHATQALAGSLADVVRPTRLSTQEAYLFLRRLVNPDPARQPARLLYDQHVDYFMADSPLDVQPDHLLLGGYTVQALSMKEPPAHTYAHMLQKLHQVPGEWLACLQWHRLPTAKIRSSLKWRGRHCSAIPTPSNVAIGAQVDAALLDMEVEGHAFGDCSLTLVIRDRDPHAVRAAVADAVKVMAEHDGAFIAETYNLTNAWLATIPGNQHYNVRTLALLDVNHADLSFVFALDQGSKTSAHLKAPALMVFETETAAPYWHNIHVEDVGNALTVGAIGSGKTFLMNTRLMHAQQYDPFTVIFDLGHGYRKISTALGGSYLELGQSSASGLKINPFSLPRSQGSIEFIAAFVRVLLEGDGGPKLTDRERRELYEQVESVYVLAPVHRRLFSLNLTAGAQERLNPWLVGGRFPLFDAEDGEDTLDLQRFQVFEFSAMEKFPELLEPLLFYVLHRISLEIGQRFTICVLDEAWRFVKHPVLRDYIVEALKTWRKHNAAVWLATQGLGDFKDPALLQTVIESCPTQFLLPNPRIDRTLIQERLGLHDLEFDLVAHLRPRQVFLKQGKVAKVLSLHVDDESAAIYGNDARLRLVGAA